MGWVAQAELWAWREDRPDAWVFLTLPAEMGEDVRDLAGPRTGFGSVPVVVTIGATTWRTSVFPSAEGYALPLKRAVRRAEGLEVGDVVTVEVELA
ncbi:DUF1905 domain-containing protein [Nocardioides sp.]|uniref:DUF1905 domain-containing protein n=1 Tax=Nocardioides sp. TaxID=35761 RepID=UPI0035113510